MPLGNPFIQGRPLNPLAALQQWVGPRRNTLAALGAGLASGNNFGSGVSNALMLAAQGRQADDAYATSQKAEADRRAQLNQTVEYLRKAAPQYADAVQAGVLSPGDAYKQYLADQKGVAQVDPTDTSQGRAQLGQQYGLTGNDLTEYVLTGKLPGGNQSARAGVGNPQWFQNKKTGEVRAVQPMTTGPGQDMLTGGPLPGDPTDWNAVDPVTMAGRKTDVIVDAKSAAAARAALPGAEQAAAITNRVTDALLNNTGGMSEQFGKTLGVIPNQYIPDWAAAKGSPMALFRSQLAQGQGTAFMQARQMLKGGGQITDFEGAKAEAAFSQMQLAAQNNDQQQFMQAVQDFRDAVNAGLEKLRAAANGGYAKGSPNVTGNGDGSAPSVDDLLQKYL